MKNNRQSSGKVSLVNRAKELAYRAHAGQVDKAGRPYIEHLSRVADAVADDPEAEAVAWLHDVLEDCHDVFRLVILDTFTRWVYSDCALLDRNRSYNNVEYYACLRSSNRALRVKLADIADNADEARLTLLDDKTADRLRRKYAKALAALSNDQ